LVNIDVFLSCTLCILTDPLKQYEVILAQLNKQKRFSTIDSTL